MVQGNVQLGKNRVTDNFIETLRNHFKRYESVKVSVLKSARESKEMVKNYAEEIADKLGRNYTAKTIGFSIFVRKWRKPVR